MAGPTLKKLGVKWHKQDLDYYCGPAVAQMFLCFFGTLVSQSDLWKEIKGNTNGSRPNGAPTSGDPFCAQVCDNCPTVMGGPPEWICWDTTPEALQKTIAAHYSDKALGAHYESTFDDGVKRVIESVDDLGVPALVTVYGFNHWVIVDGYRRDDVTMPSELVGGYELNGLWVTDPFKTDTVESVKFVSVKEWHNAFGLLSCGPHTDTHPIVAGEKFNLPWAVVKAIVASAAVFFLWRWWQRWRV